MTREYFNGMALKWDMLIAEKDRNKLEFMVQNLNIEPGSTVLDVGTGTGIFIPFLLKKTGAKGKLVCLDYAKDMLNLARAKNYGSNIDYICCDIAATQFSDEVFDAVICYSSFPHFQDKPKCLYEIFRLLKNGGGLYICHTSSRSEINKIHHKVDTLKHDLLPENDRMFQMLSGAGFREIVITDTTASYLASAKK